MTDATPSPTPNLTALVDDFFADIVLENDVSSVLSQLRWADGECYDRDISRHVYSRVVKFRHGLLLVGSDPGLPYGETILQKPMGYNIRKEKILSVLEQIDKAHGQYNS